MTILVDMDDTIENLTEAWVNYANHRFGTTVCAKDVSTWDPSTAFPGVSHEEMYALLDEDALYRTVVPLPGAVTRLQQLITDGHKVFIVTNTPYAVVKIKMEEILFRYFPFLRWKDVILTAHKSMIRGDVLIDDGPQNLTDFSGLRLLFSAPHNRAFDAAAHGMTRVGSWDEIYRLLVTMPTIP